MRSDRDLTSPIVLFTTGCVAEERHQEEYGLFPQREGFRQTDQGPRYRQQWRTLKGNRIK